MNLLRFALEAGRRLGMAQDGDDDEEGSGDRGAKTVSAGVGGGQRNAQALRRELSELGFDADKVDIHVRGGKVKLSGKVDTLAEKEKILIAAGNVEGVSEVLDKIDVERGDDEPSDFHTVEKGDTLYAISKRYYGKGAEYKDLFEANKPFLKDPDRIYPGQVLRIPKKKPIK